MIERISRYWRPARPVALARGAAVLLVLGGLCYSSVATALGLGELTLRSYLNQPFKAEIELSDTAGLEASEVSASIASPEAYARAGIDRAFFLNDLRFNADFSGGRKVLHVTSSKAVTEPYLNFLVEVNRPGGQLLRAFTVLLDPPGTVVLPSPPVAQAPSRAAAPARAPAAVKPAAGPAAPKAPSATEAQLQRSLDSLQAQVAALQGEVQSKDQALVDLQNQLTQALATPTEPSAPSVTADPLDPSAPPDSFETAPTAPSVASSPEPLAEQAPAPTTASIPAQAPVVAPAPVTPATSAAPVAAAPVVMTPASDDDGFGLLIPAALALLVLLLALLWVVRRNRQRQEAPLDEETDSSFDDSLQDDAPVAAAVVPAPSARSLPQQEPVAPMRRDSAPATDALDGASIYIAYGRFNEALGILREGLAKQPERVDLRFRLMEVIGQQGDVEAFEEQARAAEAVGVTPERIQQIRAQSPKLEAAMAASAAAATAAAALAVTAASLPRAAEPEPVEPPEPDRPPVAQPMASEPDFDFDLEPAFDDPVPVLSDNPEAPDSPMEFQLNLDDLSMDADWSAVSPFDTAAPTRKASLAAAEPEPVDPVFNTNLRELPEVYEMPDEQFLSDFANFDEPLLEAEPVVEHTLDQDDIDNAFLDSFNIDSDLPDLEALTVDFDSLESQQASAEKLEQAQAMVQDGDFESASDLLHELLRDGDPTCKSSARELLASLR
jgi:pilus assembly protein FimV